MLSILGFATIILFMFLVMTNRMSAFVAIVVSPTIFAIIGGFGKDLGPMMLEGIKLVAPTAVLLLFAVLYFGIMMNAGLFDPVSRKILQVAKGDPVKIIIGTAILALLVALDGDGTTSYMIICSAMLPIYKRIGINPLILATIAVMSLGTISGMTPWGGAATRGISVLGLDATEYFSPLIPAILCGSAWIILTAYIMGRMERKRIGIIQIEKFNKEFETNHELAAAVEEEQGKNFKFVWFNFLLTLTLMVALVLGLAPLPVLFIIGFVIALSVNHPNLAKQKPVIKEHASHAVPVVMLVLGAGIFTGILSETKMVDSMASDLLTIVPDSFGPFFTLIVALISLPLSFLMSNDAFFFGALPVLAQSASQYGIDSIEIARAAVIGQPLHSMGPTSAPLWVLLELVRRDLGQFQRYALIPVTILSLMFIVFALITGAISIAW
ncbi:CitMHS family transporter [Metabacillus sediminilitoris]|uniref:Damage-inducible protein CinA n=1 Tax=Metabacillus sediminilitoris TaxID=2567941 RepID=A0A4S4BKY7_9BACI|nr:citrate:proton symporter [Metabacillus sediminilitoris]QGQ45844.1 damage-inducible protein CinA [Metabacillus sediminilitoris]THF75205.1 damage-inducible protein CinA [Metabacillus sediminilitoris]